MHHLLKKHHILAIHCVWGNWTVGACSVGCGTGTRTNTRDKSVEESNGGTCTGKSTEIIHCNEAECKGKKSSLPHMYIRFQKSFSCNTNHKCDLIQYIGTCEWDKWVIGTCSLSCGGGIRTNTRSLLSGDDCPGNSTIEESCSVQECPGYELFDYQFFYWKHFFLYTLPAINIYLFTFSVDCVWSSWSTEECSVECGGDGVRLKHRYKVETKLNGGTPCNGTANMTDPCNNGECGEF